MRLSLTPWLVALAGLAAAHSLNSTSIEPETHQLQRRASPGDFYLRILPLGASIVWGYLSSDGNGFRQALRDQLRYAGWEVNMVGTKNNGDMHDNNVEAHPGDIISQIHTASELDYKYLPNLVVVNAGTNDCADDVDVANAHTRLGDMLDGLFNAIPNTTIIVSTLLPNGHTSLAANSVIYNANLRAMLAKRIEDGQKIVMAEMMTGFITINDIQDGTHPTDAGYKKMASVFWYAIQAALDLGYVTAPADSDYPDSSNTTVCLKSLGDTKTMEETQIGSGTDDGIYVHKSTDMGIAYTITREAADVSNNFWFADVLGSGRDDLIEFLTTDNGTAEFKIHKNNGGGSFTALDDTVDVGIFCNARGVRWSDFNADGLEDFICIGPDGGASLSINDGGSPPTFKLIGLIIDNKEELQDRVRLGDIDGDGRCDYCVIHDNGDMHCWRNGGQGLAPTSAYGGSWQDLGIVFTGNTIGDIAGTMLVDINGDHRSDWLSMTTSGKVYTYTNSRYCIVDTTNFPLNWQDAGWTHNGMGVDGARDYIKFARFYGSTGYHSYIYITNTTAEDKKYTYHFHAFLNEGAGGTRRKADGDHYCDMRGNGADDYIWVGTDGSLTIFGNEHSPPNWLHYGLVYTIDNVYDRRSIHFADMDGDGKCDVLHVNTVTGETEIYRNDYDAGTDKFSFTYLGFGTGSISCTEGMGTGLRDLGVRFADIDGNGLADYLCIELDGRTTGWLNEGNGSWTDVGQVKVSVGDDRANHRFVDVNGDGRADFMWIDKFTGEARVWLNEGQEPALGSSFTWTDEGFRYAGQAQGHCMHYPNLGGLGLADMTYAHSTVNNAETWFNTCGGTASTNGDDGPVTDPKLEVYTWNSTSTSILAVESSGMDCVAGTGPSDPADLKSLCAFGCQYGICPEPCYCIADGDPNFPTDGDGSTATAVSGQEPGVDDLCDFACPRGYCPKDLCVATSAAVTSSASSPSSTSSATSPSRTSTANKLCTDGKAPSGYGDWVCISCSSSSVADTVSGDVRWTNADANDCLGFLINWYQIGESGGAVWPAYGTDNVVAQWAAYLEVTPSGVEPENRNCFLDAQSCSTINICDSDYPAGSLIFDAFSNVHQLFQSIYDGLTDAATSIDTEIETIAATFATVTTDDETALKIALDIVSLAYGQFAGGVWNKILKDSAFFTASASRKNDQGWYKDATNNMVSTGIAIAKDTGQAAQIRINQVKELGQDLSGLFDQFQSFTDDHLTNLFNGSDSGLSDLKDMLDDGVFAEPSNDVTQATMKPIFKAAMLSMLIPAAWQLSTDINPVILVQPGANNQTNPFKGVYYGLKGEESPGNLEGANNWGLSDKQADELRITVGDNTLYMFSVQPGVDGIVHANPKLLPGFSDLTSGNTDWAGLTFSDMVTSSYYGYQLNGNANGYTIDPSKADTLLYLDGSGTIGDFSFQAEYATPGYYSFPVCSVEEIVYNAYHAKSHPAGTAGKSICDYYPCCGITAKEIKEVDDDSFTS